MKWWSDDEVLLAPLRGSDGCFAWFLGLTPQPTRWRRYAAVWKGSHMKTRFSILRVLAVIIGIVLVALGVAYHQGVFQVGNAHPPANSIMVIAPYRHAGTWVFDDEAVGLRREPFVGGVPEMIDEMVKEIPDADAGFRLTFSTQEFPGYSHKLVWRRGDSTGNWYYCQQVDMEGWLCPALFRYYKEAPEEIYVKAEAK